MSTTNVETEVVQMRFDNKNFEKNVKESMDSVDKLKDKLNFDTETKSFQKLEENAKKVNFNPLIDGLEKVKASFSMLDTFSFTIYQRLSNRLIDIGHKITAGVSTDGIKSGFSEYELKMNSFKTIKASAGKDFSDAKINEYLEELNKYADRTIYSFSDMTNNIGKFTNAGVKLDVAVQAIKGISNEAAVSGANAQEASRAMYNFSQALSAGYVKLIDWKSIENANMATEEFKTQLLETAAELNVVKKNADGSYKTIKKGTPITATKNFNESLQEQWMTTEVLTKTLAKYANETTDIGKKAFDAAQKVNTFSKMMDTLKESVQSGWSQIWELVIGDLEHATNLWTALSNAIGGVIDKFFAERKAVIQTWKENGGLERTLQALKDILKGLGAVLDAVSRAWHSVFPAKSTEQKAQGLMNLTVALESFAKKIQPGSKILQQITNTFKGFFSVLNIVREAAKAFYNTFGKFFLRILKDALGTIFDVSGGLGQMLYSISKSVTQNQTFYKTFKSIVDILEWVYNGVKKVAGILWDFAGTVKDAVGESGGFTAFKKWFDGLKQAIMNFDIGGIASSIGAMFKGLWNVIDKTIENTFDFYKPFKEKMVDFKNQIKNSKFGQWVVDFYKKIVDGVQKIFDSFRDVKTDGIDEMNEKTQSKLGIFEKIVNFFKKVGEVIKKVAMTIWPFIKKVVSSLATGIQMLWSGVTENLKNSDMGDTGGLLAGGGLLALGMAIKQFVSKLSPMFKVISMIGNGGFLKNIFSILENASKLIKAKIIREIAVSLLILVGALFVLCTLPQDKVVAATASMGVLFQGLTSVFKSLDGTDSTTGADGAKSTAARLFGIAATLLAISVAMVALTIALKKIAVMDVEQLTVGVTVLGLLFRMISSTINQILSAGARLKGKNKGTVDIQAKGVASMIKQIGKSLIYIMAAVVILARVADKYGAGTAIGAVIGIIAIMTVVGSIMESIMMYSQKQDSLQITGTKALGIALSIFALGFVFKELANALAVVIASIASLSALLSHNVMDPQWVIFSMGIFRAVILTVLGSIYAVTKLAEKVEYANIGKVTLLIGVITLFVDAMAILVAVMSLLPKSWAVSGSSVILAIAASISLIMLALAAMLKNYELSYVDVKGIATIMSSITLAILAVTAALAAISMAVGEESSTKAILIILGIAAAIAGIVLAIGKFNKVAKGVKIFANAMGALGIAAAGFAAAALLIVMTISKVSKMSDSEISKIGTNMKKVATAILSAADQLIGILAGLIRITVETVITTAVTTIIGSAGRIIDGLIELCDVLMVKAPTFVEKLILVLAEVLAQFERRCGPLIAQVVSTVATIIEQVAQAILDNADKIINAIDKVITAVSTLIVKSIAKIFGFDKFKGAVNTLIKIVKPFTAVLIGMFAVSKIKAGATAVANILNMLKGTITKFIATAKTSGLAEALFHESEYIAIRDKIQDALAQGASKTSKWMLNNYKTAAVTLGKAALNAALIAASIGNLIAGVINEWTEAIDATTTKFEDMNSDFYNLEQSIDEQGKRIKDSWNKSIDDMKSIDTKFDSADLLKKRLTDAIDITTGKIKKGREDEVATLAEEMQSQLGVRIQLEDNIVKLIDAQGQARKFDLETLEKQIKLEQFKEKLEQQKQRKSELEEELGTAKENRNKAETYYKESVALQKVFRDIDQRNEEAKSKFNADEISREEYDSLMTSINNDMAEALKKARQYSYGVISEDSSLQEALDYFTDANVGLTRYAYEQSEKNVQKISSQIQNIEDAEQAYLDGKVDEMEKYSLVFSGYYKTNLTDTQKQEEIKSMSEKMAEALDKVEESVYSQVKGTYEAIKKYKEELGESTDELDKQWEEYQKKYEARGGKTESKEDTKTGSSVTTKVVSGAKTVANKVGFGWGDTDATEKQSEENGKYIAKGQISGYYNELKSKYATDKTQAANDSLLKGVETEWGISSPSKVMEDRVGKYLGQGIVAGMENVLSGYEPSQSTNDLITKLQSSIFPAIASLTGQSSLLGGLFPVNFGGIQNGSGLSGTANAPALSFAAPLPYQASLDTINTNLSKLTDRMVEQTNSITNEIKGLRTDVTDLGTRIDGLEVMLDGDALVGRLTPRINNSLVTYANRAGRGV